MSMETVDIGQTLTLNCSYMIYDPNSILHVKWEKNSTSGELSYIDTSDTSKYDGSVATNPSLTIKNIDINDLGGYWCEVKNSDGTGKSPYITVQLPQGKTYLNTCMISKYLLTQIYSCLSAWHIYRTTKSRINIYLKPKT